MLDIICKTLSAKPVTVCGVHTVTEIDTLTENAVHTNLMQLETSK